MHVHFPFHSSQISLYQVNEELRKGEDPIQMLHLRKIRCRRQAARRDVLQFQEVGHRGEDARVKAPVSKDLVGGVEARARGLEVSVQVLGPQGTIRVLITGPAAVGAVTNVDAVAAVPGNVAQRVAWDEKVSKSG